MSTDERGSELDATTEATAATEEAAATEATAAKEMSVDDLFVAMKTRKREMYAILDYCLVPQAASAVNDYVDELQKDDRSVYSGAILCNMLERSHALEKVDKDGAPLPSEPVEPVLVKDEEGDYLVCGDEIQVCWLTTDEGREKLEAWNPVSDAIAIATKNPDHTHIYLQVLRLCAQGEGKTIAELSEAVDDDPAIQKPRFFAAHFTDNLETAQALSWSKTWKTTEIGKEALAELEKQVTA